MLSLGIDTSTMWLNLALAGEGGEILAAFHQRVGTHTSRLLPALERVLGDAGRRQADIASVGAVLGPGSFTGLRVGLATASGLCAALGVPSYGVDSLTALALSCGHDGQGAAVMDARRGEVYVRRFVKEGRSLSPMDEARSAAPDDAIPASWRPDWAIGDGVPLVPAWPGGCATVPDIPNLAVMAALHALAALEGGLAGEVLTPAYVREPDVRAPAAFAPGS